MRQLLRPVASCEVQFHVDSKNAIYQVQFCELYSTPYHRPRLFWRILTEDKMLRSTSCDRGRKTNVSNVASAAERYWHAIGSIFYLLMKWGDPLHYLKHWQRHNGPEGWVLLTKVTSLGHITSSYSNLQYLDQAPTSKSQPSISISTKLTNLDQT